MNEKQRMWKLAGRFSAVGIEMAIAISIGALGGRWLDQRLNTKPYLLFAGLIIGFGAAARVIVRIIKQTDMNKL